MICHQPDVNKIDLHAKDPFEAKYQLFINKRKNVISKPYNICEAFIEYSNGYFTIQSFLSVAKNIRLNSTQMKKRKRKNHENSKQMRASRTCMRYLKHHSQDIDFKDFMNLCK